MISEVPLLLGLDGFKTEAKRDVDPDGAEGAIGVHLSAWTESLLPHLSMLMTMYSGMLHGDEWLWHAMKG